MIILALDLGTRCGHALRIGDRTISGMRNCGIRANEGPGQRWMRFRELLNALATHGDIGAVYFENVQAHGPGVTVAHVYGGFLAHLEHWCEVRRIPLYGVGVGTIKKHWTGSGRSDKAAMKAEAKRRGLTFKDDNEVDALALLDYAMNAEGTSTPTTIEAAAERSVAETWVSPFEAAV